VSLLVWWVRERGDDVAVDPAGIGELASFEAVAVAVTTHGVVELALLPRGGLNCGSALAPRLLVGEKGATGSGAAARQAASTQASSIAITAP
jgi:hypothetical protein